MKDKKYYIELISKLLCQCSADTVKAVYIVICNMTERSKLRGIQKTNYKDN